MSNNDIIKNIKPIKLTDDELRMYSDYSNSDARIARNHIWSLIEKDAPLPKVLKQILLELLQSEYTGMTKPLKNANWELIIKEVTYLIRGIKLQEYPNIERELTRKEAAEVVAEQHFKDAETVYREYSKPKYTKLIEMINSQG